MKEADFKGHEKLCREESGVQSAEEEDDDEDEGEGKTGHQGSAVTKGEGADDKGAMGELERVVADTVAQLEKEGAGTTSDAKQTKCVVFKLQFAVYKFN